MPEPEEGGNVEAMPSADNGNIPVDAPNPEPTPADPAEKPGADPTPAVEPELFELPDGRKVDAATLSQEWKEKFMPDYTRKSQELARKTTPDPATLPDNKPAAKVYEDPEWAPKSYAELIAIAKEEVKSDFRAQDEARASAAKAIEDAVVGQLSEIKALDPAVNENALFEHAMKYGFQDLKLAHQNMKDMSATIKKTQTETAKNIAKRADPVSINPGANGARPSASNFSNSIEYLRSLKTN